MIASNDEVVQLNLAHTNGTVRHPAAKSVGNGDLMAVEFDPRRELMFWIDNEQKAIYRSALPKGIRIFDF